MRQLQEIAHQRDDMKIIVQLTSAFEDLASLNIRQIKAQVLQSQRFFDDLWNIYSQVRVDNLFGFGRSHSETPVSNKELYIVVTSPGGFSGDIDQRLIESMLSSYDKDKHEIIVIGRHGATLLMQAGVAFKKYYKMPVHNKNINVEPLVREIRQYKSTTVFYQAYISLMIQEIRHIEMSAAVKKLGEQAEIAEEVISEHNYIFEPSAFDVIAHLERSMLQIALSQVIFDSKLAQYASRFRAMRSAHELADDSLGELKSTYNRTKRSERDEQLKQTINSLRKANVL